MTGSRCQRQRPWAGTPARSSAAGIGTRRSRRTRDRGAAGVEAPRRVRRKPTSAGSAEAAGLPGGRRAANRTDVDLLADGIEDPHLAADAVRARSAGREQLPLAAADQLIDEVVFQNLRVASLVVPPGNRVGAA